MNERIKQIRKYYGLTLAEFGEKIGISTVSCSKFEHGKLSPSRQTILLICKEYDVNQNWLLTGEGEMLTERSDKEKIADFIGSLLANDSGGKYPAAAKFKGRLVAALAGLTDAQWDAMEMVVNALLAQHQQDEAKKPPDD